MKKQIVVEGRSTGAGGDVSIIVTPIVVGPGCLAAVSADLEETLVDKVKIIGKRVCTAVKVGRNCPAVNSGVVTPVSLTKATFAVSSNKVKAQGSFPLRKDDTASGGVCSCTLTASPFTPFNMTFTGSIDNAGQTKVAGE